MSALANQVYRHLLHNTLMRDSDDRFDPSIIRLGILLLLFDVYLTWARIEKQSSGSASSSDGSAAEDGGGDGTGDDGTARGNFGRLAQQPIVFQYLFFRTYRTVALPTMCG